MINISRWASQQAKDESVLLHEEIAERIAVVADATLAQVLFGDGLGPEVGHSAELEGRQRNFEDLKEIAM